MTDSGGLQEEAPALHKPVLVMREGQNGRKRSKPEQEVSRISQTGYRDAVNNLLTDPELYKQMSSAPNPYGDGQAAQRICKILQEKYE